MPCLHKYRVGHNTLSTQVLGRPLSCGVSWRKAWGWGQITTSIWDCSLWSCSSDKFACTLPCTYNTSCAGRRLSKGEIWNEMEPMEPMEQNGTNGTLFYLADIAQQSSLLWIVCLFHRLTDWNHKWNYALIWCYTSLLFLIWNCTYIIQSGIKHSSFTQSIFVVHLVPSDGA